MRIEIRHRCADADSFRAASIKSLFNVDSGAGFALDAELPFEDVDWAIGVVVGPSGSGKTSIGRAIFGDDAVYRPTGWRDDAPIVDCIAPGRDVDEVTGALSAVGLGSVPTWLRPYAVLSNGERFRADLAAIVCAAPDRVVIDEFTSVVDRQIARIGAMAFAKAWRRTGGQAVLLSCHYDILEHVEADWVYDTQSGTFLDGRERWKRPQIELDVEQVDGSWWPRFEPHHYLTLPRMPAARYFVGFVDREPVAHVAVAPRIDFGAVRACRLVIMPEWQGAGIGLRFLNAVCAPEALGQGRFGERCDKTWFHTSHPGLNAALSRSGIWERMSASLYGAHKGKSQASMAKSGAKVKCGYGGHFRAVTGWRMTRAAAASCA